MNEKVTLEFIAQGEKNEIKEKKTNSSQEDKQNNLKKKLLEFVIKILIYFKRIILIFSIKSLNIIRKIN